MVGSNNAEFVDAIGIDQLLEILNGLAALKLTNAGPELLPGVFFQRFQEIPRFGREYRNNGLGYGREGENQKRVLFESYLTKI